MRRAVLVSCVAALLGVVAPAARATPARAALEHEPVLLVHGFGGSGSGWRAMVTSLRAAGWPADAVDAMTYDSHRSNVEIADVIAREAAALRARTGATAIDVVSHSMGAIASRYYLERLGGAAHVDAWVSLAGVNRGTWLAYGCYALAPCREMAPSSSLLDQLNAQFPPAGRTRYATWWSPCDRDILPTSNAKLPGATNHETTCLGHSALKSDPTVLREVERFLVGARAHSS